MKTVEQGLPIWYLVSFVEAKTYAPFFLWHFYRASEKSLTTAGRQDMLNTIQLDIRIIQLLSGPVLIFVQLMLKTWIKVAVCSRCSS